MKKRFFIILSLLASSVIALPVSFFITILLTPLWSLFESVAGVESLGHSGPSDWCFILVYIVLITAGLIIIFHLNTRKRDNISK